MLFEGKPAKKNNCTVGTLCTPWGTETEGYSKSKGDFSKNHKREHGVIVFTTKKKQFEPCKVGNLKAQREKNNQKGGKRGRNSHGGKHLPMGGGWRVVSGKTGGGTLHRAPLSSQVNLSNLKARGLNIKNTRIVTQEPTEERPSNEKKKTRRRESGRGGAPERTPEPVWEGIKGHRILTPREGRHPEPGWVSKKKEGGREKNQNLKTSHTQTWKATIKKITQDPKDLRKE